MCTVQLRIWNAYRAENLELEGAGKWKRTIFSTSSRILLNLAFHLEIVCSFPFLFSSKIWEFLIWILSYFNK